VNRLFKPDMQYIKTFVLSILLHLHRFQPSFAQWQKPLITQGGPSVCQMSQRWWMAAILQKIDHRMDYTSLTRGDFPMLLRGLQLQLYNWIVCVCVCERLTHIPLKVAPFCGDLDHHMFPQRLPLSSGWVVQKWLNWLRCRLEGWLVRVQGTIIVPAKGNITYRSDSSCRTYATAPILLSAADALSVTLNFPPQKIPLWCSLSSKFFVHLFSVFYSSSNCVFFVVNVFVEPMRRLNVWS